MRRLPSSTPLYSSAASDVYKRQVLGDSSSQRGLAMVDVADGADVDMGLILNKMLFCHLDESSLVNSLTFGIAFLHLLHHTRQMPI